MIPTEKLLAILQDRAQNVSSTAECSAILLGVSRVIGDLTNNPALPPRNQGIASVAEGAAMTAANIKDNSCAPDGVFGAMDELLPSFPESVRHVEIGIGPSVLAVRRGV